ncbi:hypothetical protein BS47DRAFT_932459 [Hydnum rufescens UP504]|uniref:Uncharacterized protein n=1 Tax=Hydnum rufescens UP504 TaxID=1448309 RepID=A0A9P6DWI7_9AGAM|nr:hypothetical protein BS47DRAFT_932459 [Hydnum rufescens UP504]
MPRSFFGNRGLWDATFPSRDSASNCIVLRPWQAPIVGCGYPPQVTMSPICCIAITKLSFLLSFLWAHKGRPTGRLGYLCNYCIKMYVSNTTHQSPRTFWPSNYMVICNEERAGWFGVMFNDVKRKLMMIPAEIKDKIRKKISNPINVGEKTETWGSDNHPHDWQHL